MIYDILSKSDFNDGALLIVTFPESDLDKKALYTIENDKPDFLVPFKTRNIDGMIECTYYLENRTKLQYLYKIRQPAEYLSFWNCILNPVLQCNDWFLKIGSFVFDANYIYATQSANDICYIYIPTKNDCSNSKELHNMVCELVEKNTVSDANIENQILRAIMRDFNPKEFLKMLKEKIQIDSNTPIVEQQTEQKTIDNPINPSVLNNISHPSNPNKPINNTSTYSNGDIVINMNKEPKKKGLFGSAKKPKQPKPVKEDKKPKFGLFKNKKQDIILGANINTPIQPEPSLDKKIQIPVYENQFDDELTQIDDNIGVPLLKLVGKMGLPQEIKVDILPNQIFTIGRFDVSVGQKQSNFEFDKSTKAVSRRHAAIERTNTGYQIMDLSSSAGTYVNGEKLLPSVPKQLNIGAKISFGTAGADYVWDE